MRKIVITLIFISFYHVLAVFVSSCNELSCAGGDVWLIPIAEVSADVYETSDNDTIPVNAIVDTLLSTNMLIKLDLMYELALKKNELSLFSQVYADVGPTYQMITDIEVFSNQDYDEDHPAGTALSDIINVYQAEQHWSLDDYLGSVNQSYSPLDTFFIYISSPPEELRAHEFSLRIQKDDGNEFRIEMSTIILK